MPYIFYDTETTGLSSAFDQILQFAAIVTDRDFSVLEEINLRGRRRPFILPSPGALMVTGISPEDFETAPLSHYQLITEIRQLIERHSPTVLIGYNSLKFDESMLRQAFYQTLHPTYLTQLNGNSRMDVMRLAHAVAEHRPDALIVPLNERKRSSFRLGDLSDANGIELSNAHDALADTRATLDLARLLRRNAPDVWEMVFQARTKQKVKRTLEENPIVVFTDQAFSTKSILASPVTENPENDNEVGLFDLSNDPTQFFDVAPSDAIGLLTQSPRIIRTLKANQLPILRPARESDFNDVSRETATARIETLHSHPTFSQTVANAMANRYEERSPSPHVEEQIFDGFPSSADQRLMEEFHKTPWERRPALVEQLSDPRIREFGTRLIFEEHPELLSEETRGRLETLARERVSSSEEVPWTTLAAAKEELGSLTIEAGERRELARTIGAWLDRFS